MKLKRMTATVMAIMTMAAMGTSLVSMRASAYTAKDTWKTSYLKNQPSNSTVTYSDSCTIYSYGGGYQTYCADISGATDRYVKVYGDVTSYNMTAIVYSTKKTISTSNATVTFKFQVKSSTDGRVAKANGSVGYFS